jgi:hypothetical protein
MERYKIFGIGLGKTGTNSLTEALNILGYRAKHYPDPEKMLTRNFTELLNTYDALTDSPVIPVYKELDKMYPNSKFIFTIRNEDDWIPSCKVQWAKSGPYMRKGFYGQLRKELFGTVEFNEKRFRDKNRKHIEDVKKYFKDRPNDLLIMNICEGDGWEVLCKFLDKSVLNIPFPKLNIMLR